MTIPPRSPHGHQIIFDHIYNLVFEHRHGELKTIDKIDNLKMGIDYRAINPECAYDQDAGDSMTKLSKILRKSLSQHYPRYPFSPHVWSVEWESYDSGYEKYVGRQEQIVTKVAFSPELRKHRVKMNTPYLSIKFDEEKMIRTTELVSGKETVAVLHKDDWGELIYDASPGFSTQGIPESFSDLSDWARHEGYELGKERFLVCGGDSVELVAPAQWTGKKIPFPELAPLLYPGDPVVIDDLSLSAEDLEALGAERDTD